MWKCAIQGTVQPMECKHSEAHQMKPGCSHLSWLTHKAAAAANSIDEVQWNWKAARFWTLADTVMYLLVFLGLLSIAQSGKKKIVEVHLRWAVPRSWLISVYRHPTELPGPVDYPWEELSVWRSWWFIRRGECVVCKSTWICRADNAGPETADHSRARWSRRRWADNRGL